jgi:hypothetical protein
MKLALRFLAFWTVVFLVGCGGVQYGEVSGNVTHRGAALKVGTISFWPQGSAGNPVKSEIAEDGTYSAMVPVGEVNVTVETLSASGKVQTGIPGGLELKKGRSNPGGPPPEVVAQIRESMERSGTTPTASAPSAGYVKIDQKYSNPKTSGITLTVHTGHQDFNVPLN